TERNTEQDWLKTNLARFTNILQGQLDLTLVGKILLSELAPLVGKSLAELEPGRVRRLAPFRVDGEERQDRLPLVGIH
ncbi:hypothetical protein ACC695_40905, partial [Rhizobium ruizarguesonis]